MSVRRLPLFSTSERPAAPVSAARQVLPGRAIIVADTGADVSALTWAARFVEELGQRGRRLPVVLCTFTGSRAAGAGDFERLAGASSVRTVVAAQAAEQLPAVAGHDLWVLVGQPGLIAADGWLSVLLTTEAPLLRWAPGLRALRGGVSLALSGEGLEVATALARGLAAG